jgi:hypothetical protein
MIGNRGLRRLQLPGKTDHLPLRELVANEIPTQNWRILSDCRNWAGQIKLTQPTEGKEALTMDTHQFTPDALAAAGRALFGQHWQGQLSRVLEVNDRTLRRWLAGELSMPESIEYEMRELLEERLRIIGSLLASIGRSDVAERVRPSDEGKSL